MFLVLPLWLEVARVPCPPDLNSYRLVFKAPNGATVDATEVTDPLLIEHFGTVTPGDMQLITAYYKAGMFDRVIAIWDTIIAKQPDNAQYILSRGAAYAANGDFTTAIEQVELVIEKAGFKCVFANDNDPKSYTWQHPAWYYRMVQEDRSWMFKIESGSPSLPADETGRKRYQPITLSKEEMEALRKRIS